MNQTEKKPEIRNRMASRGVSSEVIDAFIEMVECVEKEPSAYVPLDSVAAADTDLILDPDFHEIHDLEDRGRHVLNRVVVIKLNGGRSTTMGGEAPKGILSAKDGLSYLEIIARQMEALQSKWAVDIPLLLMNSFFTHKPTMEIMERVGAPVMTFLQSQVPRLVADTLTPLRTGTEEDWAPPGHGDVYKSLKLSGLLDKLLAQGRRWALVSNLDNLAAVPEPWIVGLLERERIDFLLEVTDRTDVDLKGGILVAQDARLDLLEIAQVAPSERHLFTDVDRFRVFNTNNVWVDLESLAQTLERGRLRLPIIRNYKEVAGITVIQLETAMGAAVGSFPNARGLRVTRERFFPTKKVEDLFLLHSDACILDSMYRLRTNPQRSPHLPSRPKVVFSPDFLDSPLKMGSCFEDPTSVSLVDAVSLEVSGSVYFHRNVKIKGSVKVNAPDGEVFHIEPGTILEDCACP
jgi:UTP--glucose-1-phosphate uridylyltransferase